MSEIKFEIVKKIGVLSKSASGWAERTNPPCLGQRDLQQADTSQWEREIDQLVASRQFSPSGMNHGLAEAITGKTATESWIGSNIEVLLQ